MSKFGPVIAVVTCRSFPVKKRDLKLKLVSTQSSSLDRSFRPNQSIKMTNLRLTAEGNGAKYSGVMYLSATFEIMLLRM